MATPSKVAQQEVTNSYADDDVKNRVERLRAVVANLEREADSRVGKRKDFEDRWLKDLRQFHGFYEPEIEAKFDEAKNSKLFINQTRPKTNTMEARLSDMLFPTDDRNWGIEPTPVPELTVNAEQTAMQAAEAKRQAAAAPQDQNAQIAARDAEDAASQIKARMDEARKRARAMQEEIDDHLRQCNYQIQARDVIRDACRIGTGIMKGPVIGGHNRPSWQMDPESKKFAMVDVEDKRPVYWRVDPWSFFPDFDAHSMEDCESVFERHLLNKKQMRKLARQPGFDQLAIRRLLQDQPRSSSPYWIAHLREITGAYNDSTVDRYHVWEYHGPLEAQDLKDIAVLIGKEKLLEDIDEEVDPLTELQVNLWFSQGELLKFGIHYLDSGESIYSVFNLEKDEASIFGFGIPWIMRQSQSALNGGWRALMNNAGLSSGPQVVIDDQVIESYNGRYELTPLKLWRKKTTAHPQAKPFESHDIPMHQAELSHIIEMAKQFIDDETAISVIAQGEQGTHTTQTLGGMSMLMNSVNVVFRRIVKNWDDDQTTPNIRRLYDWLMQFSQKEHIKGDFEVDARGTSVLLVREMQSANLMAFLTAFCGHAVLGKYLKKEGLPGLRLLAQTMMIPADEMVKTDEEVAEDEAKAAEQPPMPNHEILKIEAQLNLTKMKIEGEMDIAMVHRETALIELAQTHNMELEKLKGMLSDKQADRNSKERIFAGEVAVEERQAAKGQDDKGSGGYIA